MGRSIRGHRVAAHEGHLFGWLNQLVSLFTAMGLILICISAIILWWRRRPEGVLGGTCTIGKAKVYYALGGLVVALGIYLPLFGLSLLLVVVIERSILRRFPLTQRWLARGRILNGMTKITPGTWHSNSSGIVLQDVRLLAR